MNYEKSSLILEKIKSANKILLNCHKSPDADSVGSALAMDMVLSVLGKSADIVCPDKLPDDLNFLPNSGKISKIDFSKFDFSKYDLFICCDSAEIHTVTGSKEISLPEIFTVVIDHHISNSNYGNINLVEDLSSTGELLKYLFEDWNIDLNSQIANCLLAGIIGDTGAFVFHSAGAKTLQSVAKLIECGADKDYLILNLFRCNPFERVKFVGEILANMRLEPEGFVWSAIEYASFKKSGSDLESRPLAASTLMRSIAETKFALVIVETEKNVCGINLRSRESDFDVSVIAKELGGGGHKNAAAAKIEKLNFEEAVKKILMVAKKYSQSYE